MITPVRLLRRAAWMLLAATSAAHAINGGTVQATTQATNLFPASGPATTLNDTHFASLPPNSPGTTVQADAWYADGNSPWRGGGFAFARAEQVGHELKFGAAALARSWGGLTGAAHGRVEASYDITVEYGPPADPIAAGAWLASLMQRCGGSGCVMQQTFQHLTQGRLAYGSYVTDRQASYEERLTLTGDDVFHYGGRLDLGFDPSNGSGIVLGASGDWTQHDVTAFGPTPASALGLFPAGDPRNALADPTGPLAGFDFLRWEVIQNRPAIFGIESAANPIGFALTAVFHASLMQEAIAAEGSNSYNFSTLAIDFAHTSSLGVLGLTDPLGEIDFSQSPLTVTFGSAVPEPAAPWLGLAGLAGLMAWVRRRHRRAALGSLALLIGAGQAQAFTLEAYGDSCNQGVDPVSSVSTALPRVIADAGPMGADYPGYPESSGWVCHSWASAELGTARLRSYAFADTVNAGSAIGSHPVFGQIASSTLTDTLRFAAPGGVAPPPFPLVMASISMDVDGRMQGFYGDMTHDANLSLHDTTGGFSSFVSFTFNWHGAVGPAGTPLATSFAVAPVGSLSHVSLDPAQLHVTLTASFPLVAGHVYEVGMSDYSGAYAYAYGSALVDFSHTSALSLSLPPGWSYSSGSGVLLSEVPEPAPALLLSSGLAWLWRRRSSRPD